MMKELQKYLRKMRKMWIKNKLNPRKLSESTSLSQGVSKYSGFFSFLLGVWGAEYNPGVVFKKGIKLKYKQL